MDNMAVDPSAQGDILPPHGQDGDDAGQPSPDDASANHAPATREQLAQLRAEARMWRLKARAGETASEELAKLKNAGRSELERATSALAEAEQRTRAAELRALRLEVAHEKRLPAQLASRLQGDTRDEMLADADALLSAIPQQQQQQPGIRDAGQHANAAPGAAQSPDAWLRSKLQR